MKHYALAYEAFCEAGGESFRTWRAMTREAMQGLIARYGLAGKRVLSLGAGSGFEESWLVEAGCEVTLLDNSPGIERHIQGVAKAAGGRCVDFVIGDAADLPAAHGLESFDVVYVSSLAPDEHRRLDLQKAFVAARPVQRVLRQLPYVGRVLPWGWRTWPAGTDPFHAMVAGALSSRLAPGGLFIAQQYLDGLYLGARRDARLHARVLRRAARLVVERMGLGANPLYREDVRRQLRDNGVQLLEFYCFRRSRSHHLVVGYKGSAPEARSFAVGLQGRPPIRTFHGRYPHAEVKTDVVKVI